MFSEPITSIEQAIDTAVEIALRAGDESIARTIAILKERIGADTNLQFRLPD